MVLSNPEIRTFTRWYREMEQALAYMVEFREEIDDRLVPLNFQAICATLKKTPRAVSGYLYKNRTALRQTYRLAFCELPRGRAPRLSYSRSLAICHNILEDVRRQYRTVRRAAR